MTDFIYSRVSTDKQDVESQLVLLRSRFPDAKVISETASGAKARPELQKLLKRLKKGDRLIVAALDRLGRKVSEVLLIVEDLDKRKVVLISLREQIDYGTLAGKLVTQILLSVAEMERNLISERTKAGLKAAKARGVKLGSAPIRTPEQEDLMLKMRAEGSTLRDISKATGFSPEGVRKALRTLNEREELRLDHEVSPSNG
jgi:DNA invertase Pin-like site-specific DNA recombinase